MLGGLVFSAERQTLRIWIRVRTAGAFLNGAMPEIAPAISGNWSAVVAFTNLLFTNSVGLTSVPGTDELCVWEREGRIWTFENSPGATQKKLVLDIHNQCQGWDDSGLLGVAFHPGFATNHFMFVYYTWVKPGTVAGDPNTRPNPILPDTYHDRLERYTLDANGVAIPGSVKHFRGPDQPDRLAPRRRNVLSSEERLSLSGPIGDNSVGDNDQIINKSLYSGVFRIDVDCRGGNISHPIPRQPVERFHGKLFHPERQSVRRPVERARRIFLPRPAQSASHDDMTRRPDEFSSATSAKARARKLT